MLEVNEDINTFSINANIQNVKENILYYLKENNENRRYQYLKAVKNTLRKIGNITLRNVVDLKRILTILSRTSLIYKVKKVKLENLDKKRVDVNDLIHHTYSLVSEEEQTFFKSALDDELNIDEKKLLQLITSLHKYKKGLDQEALIGSKASNY